MFLHSPHGSQPSPALGPLVADARKPPPSVPGAGFDAQNATCLRQPTTPNGREEEMSGREIAKCNVAILAQAATAPNGREDCLVEEMENAR